MFGVDQEILKQIVEGMATLVPVVGAYYVGRRQAKHKEEREMLMNQLQTVYEPLMDICIRHDNDYSEEDATKITDLLYKNNSLVAPKLIKKWREICKNKTAESYDGFCTSLRSNYNIVKKMLEYPYDAEDIMEEDYPIGYMMMSQVAACVCSAFLVVGSVAFAATTENVIVQTVMVVIAYAFLIFTVWQIILLIRQMWNEVCGRICRRRSKTHPHQHTKKTKNTESNITE